MSKTRQRLGQLGEDLAAAYLEELDWRIIARNERIEGIRGEIDIVAADGEAVVIVEVKSGRATQASGPLDPADHVDRRKQMQLRRLATNWIRRNRARCPRADGIRIDVISQRIDGHGQVVARRHIRAAC